MDELLRGRYLWHVAETIHRASIAAQGLLPSDHGHDAEQPVGVYAWRTDRVSEAWGHFNWNYATPGTRYDVWRINLGMLHTHVTEDPAWNGEAVVILGAVSARIISRFMTFVAD